MNTHRFTGHERDDPTGLDYMLARYYSDTVARFLSVDPLGGTARRDPQGWNMYCYVLNSPLTLHDPDGQCAAPALEQGQVGFCIDTFISAPSIAVFGTGDNRGFQPNGPGSYRTRQLIVVNVTEGTVSSTMAAGTSKYLFLKGEGSAKQTISMLPDAQGDTAFLASGHGVNGLSWLPRSPDPIDYSFELEVGTNGTPSLVSWSHDGYPSYEVYAYTVDASGEVTVWVLYQYSEGEPSDLAPPTEVEGRNQQPASTGGSVNMKSGISSPLPGQRLTVFIGGIRQD